MSFIITKMNKVSINKKLRFIKVAFSFILIGDPLSFSTKINKNCPPSSIGNGKRLNAPRLILNIASNKRKGINPETRESPATFAIPTGPLKFSTPIVPFKVLNKNLKVFSIQKMV